MRHLLKLVIVVLITSCSSANYWGDIDLGSDFYYIPDPTFNSVNLSASKDDPMSISSYIVRDIEYVGFDENFILAVSKINDTLHYWVIDKTQKTKQLTNKNKSKNGVPSDTKKSYVTESTDSTNYISLKTKMNITMYSKEHYQKKSNYK